MFQAKLVAYVGDRMVRASPRGWCPELDGGGALIEDHGRRERGSRGHDLLSALGIITLDRCDPRTGTARCAGRFDPIDLPYIGEDEPTGGLL